MPTSTYRAPLWLPSGHLQTLYPALWAYKPLVSYTRERWELPDGDFVDVDYTSLPSRGDAPLIVLLHGLEGSSHSHYARALMQQAMARDCLGVVVHFRGCSGELNRLPRAYHSGDSTEADYFLRRLHTEHPQRPIYAVGVSLGGNVLLKWLGEQGRAANFVQAAAASSAPLDLAAGANALARGFNRAYTQNFLKSLKQKALRQLARHPGLFEREAVLASRNFHDFDGLVTAPLHGFKSAQDYWVSSSSKPLLRHITQPTLVLNARNDSFLPAQFLPTTADISKAVMLEQPAGGGHVGFADNVPPWSKDVLNWLPNRIFDFFEIAHVDNAISRLNHHATNRSELSR